MTMLPTAFGSVQTTTDYSLFSFLRGNRNLNTLHLRRLKDSMQKRILFSPITVNEKMQIIDGQHRFMVLKELGAPIMYWVCKGYGLEEVQILNSNMSNWKKEDYFAGWCDLGHPEYLRLRDFMKMFPELGFSQCEKLLTLNRCGTNNSKAFTEGGRKKMFEEGKFEIRDWDTSVKYANQIMDIKQFYAGFNRLQFVIAMMGVFKNQNYVHETFLQRAKLNPRAFVDCPNSTYYREMIEEIYNFRSREKVSLRF